MALKIIHREHVNGVAQVRERVAELQAKYPSPAMVTYRRGSHYQGWNIMVKAEAPTTRIQQRGHCQFCGKHQVVKDGVLVLHGYERPGHGWIFGRCPGAGKKPLQTDQLLTVAWLSTSRGTLAQLEATLPAIEKLEAEAQVVYRAAGSNGLSYYELPREPYKPTDAQKDAYQAALVTWAAQYPEAASYKAAMERTLTQKRAIGQYKAQVEHFELLLSWRLLGTPLVEVEK